MNRTIHGVDICGRDVDDQTRCAHWNSSLDIIAIKFRCCGQWYSCFECHAAIAGHEPAVWPSAEFDEKAILCGSCSHRLTIREYLDCGSTCPSCGSKFNPGCANHYHLYFQML